MRTTLCLVAAIGLLAVAQRAEAQSTTTGQPTTPATIQATPPASGTVQILPGTTYQPTTIMTSSEPTRRGLFGRRLLRRGSSSNQIVYPSTPAPAFLPSTMPSAMPGTTTGTTTTTATTDAKKPDATKTDSGVKPATVTTPDGGTVTTAGFTTTPGTQGTIIPASGTMMMTSDGRMVMMSSEMMTTTTVTKSPRRGLLSRLRR